jgi:hypothetical protein
MVSKSFTLLLTILALVVGVSSSAAATQEQVPMATTTTTTTTTTTANECVVGDNGECLTTTEDNDDSTETLAAAVIDKGCPDRGHIIRCAGKYLDTNQNGKLDRSELDAAIERLPWSVLYTVGTCTVHVQLLSHALVFARLHMCVLKQYTGTAVALSKSWAARIK